MWKIKNYTFDIIDVTVMTSFGEKVLQITDSDQGSKHHLIHRPLALRFQNFLLRSYYPVQGSLNNTTRSFYYRRRKISSVIWVMLSGFSTLCWLVLTTRWCTLFEVTSSGTFVTSWNAPGMNQHHFEIIKPHLCQAAQYVIMGQPQKCHSKILILLTKAPKWPKMTENDQMMLP